MDDVLFRWEGSDDGSRRLYAGNLPHPVAEGVERAPDRWRYDLALPGAEHIMIGPQDVAEAKIVGWAAAWFRSVYL